MHTESTRCRQKDKHKGARVDKRASMKGHVRGFPSQRKRVYSTTAVTILVCCVGMYKSAEVEFLDSFALRCIFLQTHATSYSFYSVLLYTVKEKGGKPDRKPHPLPYGFSNQKPQVWELSRLCPKILKKLYIHEFGFRYNKSKIYTCITVCSVLLWLRLEKFWQYVYP